MPRRSSIEDTILTYFRTAPPDSAALMLHLAQGEMKRRKTPAAPAKPRKPAKDPQPSLIGEEQK